MSGSLLRRNIGLLVGVVLAGQLLAGLMVVALVLRPQTVRVAEMSARMLNAVSVVLENQPPELRQQVARRIDDQGSVRLRPLANPPDAQGRKFPNFVERVFMRTLAERLDRQQEIVWRTDGEGHLWMKLDLGGQFWWVNITPPRVAGPLISLVIASLIAFIVALAGGLLLQRRLDRPLRALAETVARYRPGSDPPVITVEGPREIAAVAHAFNDMGERVAAHEQERALMLAGVSHDLRTPLARLRLSIEMMDHEDESLRESAHRQVEQIDRMLGQFLDYAREGTDEEPVEVVVADLLRQAAQDAGMVDRVAIEVEGGLMAHLRPVAICRTIKNLLENAGRHGAPPFILRARGDAGSLEINVIDHGEGFDPALAGHFLKPFARANTARGGDGTGLGLAIAHRQILDAGGMLTFQRMAQGFVATVTIPRQGR